MKILNTNHPNVHTKSTSAVETGRQLLKNNKVSLIIMCGGQGTRLGFTGPKALFPLHPYGSPLEIFLKKVKTVEKKYNTKPKIYITTNEFSHSTLQEYVYKHYKEFQITFLKHDSEECIDMQGDKIYDKDGVVRAPNGNGGIFKTLKNIYLSHSDVFQVVSIDNVLANVLDPLPIGILMENNYDVLCKAVLKKEDENVGVFVDDDGICVEEYFERNNGDSVALANICNHYFNTQFLKKMQDCELPYHFVHKKIPFLEDGVMVKPEIPNGFKKEFFIFDALKFTNKTGVLVVDRSNEFSPLKNGMDKETDNKETCLRDLKAFFD